MTELISSKSMDAYEGMPDTPDGWMAIQIPSGSLEILTDQDTRGRKTITVVATSDSLKGFRVDESAICGHYNQNPDILILAKISEPFRR